MPLVILVLVWVSLLAIFVFQLAPVKPKELICLWHVTDDENSLFSASIERGLLQNGAWRSDVITFESEDFTEDFVNLTHHVRLDYKRSNGDYISEDKTGSFEYEVSASEVRWIAEWHYDSQDQFGVEFPSHTSNRYFSVNRISLEMLESDTVSNWGQSKTKCVLNDVTQDPAI